VVISLMALALAFQVVRSAGVTHFVDGQPEIAGKIWPDHPRVILSEAMADIGVSAARGQVAKAATLAAVRDAARHAPLAVEPYLIEGAAALSAGKPVRAERLFIEAKRRDPRSAAAHFFLAQQYLSTGRAPAGLAEAALLVRLVGGSSSLVPGIAQFAGAPGSAPQLRQLFAADPVLQGEVLAYLARDARNADLVVALAGASLGRAGAAADAPLWQSTLLAALVEKGEFLRARNLWLKIAGLRSAPLGLFNPQFAKLNAPAPFNWTLSSGDFGVAEPVAPGGLQVIYYGRADAGLASQLLVLPPGSYE
jgi:hypothetical protein